MDFYLLLKISEKKISSKYSQKLLDSAKKSATDSIKTASKRAIQTTAEATGDLIGNKIPDKITSTSKKIFNGLAHCQTKLMMKYQKKDIYLHKDSKL